MTSAIAIPGLDQAPTRHAGLLAWVRSTAELTQPDRVHWCDGSDEEWAALGRSHSDSGSRLAEAAGLLDSLVLDDVFTEFLTVPAYDRLR